VVETDCVEATYSKEVCDTVFAPLNNVSPESIVSIIAKRHLKVEVRYQMNSLRRKEDDLTPTLIASKLGKEVPQTPFAAAMVPYCALHQARKAA